MKSYLPVSTLHCNVLMLKGIHNLHNWTKVLNFAFNEDDDGDTFSFLDNHSPDL